MAIADWNLRWEALRRACDRLSATFPPHRDDNGSEPIFSVQAAATDEQIAAVEADMGIQLPPSLRHVFTQYSAAVDIAWQLADGTDPPEPFDEIFSGQLYWNLQELTAIENDRKGWVENCFPDPDDSYDRIWHNKLAFAKVPNGDMIAIDQSRDGSEQVVYLSHDDGEGHGYIMGNSVEDFVDRYSLIGCLGYEDWQWLPFVADAVSGIDPHCSNAVSWRQWFKLNIDAG